MKHFLSVVSAALTLILSAPGSGAAAESIPVFVSILPQKYFVQQIGGERVNVQVMVEPGASPATYEPKPRQMAQLSRARIYFAIGVPFESTWLDKISAANPRMTVVHTEDGIRKIPMVRHAPEGAGEDSRHGILDPHIWLSPPLVKIQARAILTALQTADPSNRGIYDAGYRRFSAALDRLDSRMKALFAGMQGMRFMVFHPAWGYFAAAYGLRQVPIEIEGKTPKPAELRALIDEARRTGVRVIFVQPQFSSRSADLIAAEIGAQVVVADPLAENWLANMDLVAEKFKAALK